jgi:hypothetical protein
VPPETAREGAGKVKKREELSGGGQSMSAKFKKYLLAIVVITSIL